MSQSIHEENSEPVRSGQMSPIHENNSENSETSGTVREDRKLSRADTAKWGQSQSPNTDDSETFRSGQLNQSPNTGNSETFNSLQQQNTTNIQPPMEKSGDYDKLLECMASTLFCPILCPGIWMTSCCCITDSELPNGM